jgi:hypothetical protein
MAASDGPASPVLAALRDVATELMNRLEESR